MGLLVPLQLLSLSVTMQINVNKPYRKIIGVYVLFSFWIKHTHCLLNGIQADNGGFHGKRVLK